MAESNDQKVLEALEKVKDPVSGKSVVAAGMVKGLQIKDGHVAFAIEVSPEQGPKMEPLRKEAEKTVHALDGILTVTAVLTAEKAGNSSIQSEQHSAPDPGTIGTASQQTVIPCRV